MVKRLVSLLAVAAALVAGALVVDVQPAAAYYPDNCPTSGVGWFCLDRGYFLSEVTRYPGSIPRNQCGNADGRDETFPHDGLPGTPDTHVYSIVNTTQVEWRWFRDSWCAGASIYIYGHTSVILPTGWTGLDHASFVRTSTVG